LSDIAAGIVETGGKFATGINNTSERLHWWQNLPPVSLIPVGGGAPSLAKFRKKFETVLMGYSGAGRKLIYEKNQKQTSS
jgi:hypothetical protein